MRLSTDLIRHAPSYINPLRERELSLRGFKISKIENLGVTEDQYDALDFSDNDILKLENFPLLPKLRTLLFNNNRVCRIAKGIGEFLPKLSTLILSGNKIATIADLDALTELNSLTSLSLVNNPVSKIVDYRYQVIQKLPKLKILDFRKIKPQERKEAERRYGSVEAKVVVEVKTRPKAKTFVPGEGASSERKGLTPEEKKLVLEAIKKASSLAEIERLEKILSSGKLPKDFFETETKTGKRKAPKTNETEASQDEPPKDKSEVQNTKDTPTTDQSGKKPKKD